MYRLSPRNKSKHSVSRKSTVNHSDRALTQILLSGLREIPLHIANKGKQHRPKSSQIEHICQSISNETARMSRDIVVPKGSYVPETLREMVSSFIGYRENQITCC